MAQVYKEKVIFQKKIGTPTILGVRNPVIQKTVWRTCGASIKVERAGLCERVNTWDKKGER